MPWVWSRYARQSRGGRTGRYTARPGAARRAARPAGPYAEQSVEALEPMTKRISLAYPERQAYISDARSTRSAVVKLSVNQVFTIASGTGGSRRYNPISFEMANVSGFTDYGNVYSSFRVLRGEIVIPNVHSPVQSWVVASSQPFAETQTPIAIANVGTEASWVPSQSEGALRQTRWQRVLYPQSTTTGVRIGFKPYTLIAGYGPASTTNVFQRVWRGYNWTPFTWAAFNTPLVYFGPYIVGQSNPTDEEAIDTLDMSLTLWLQFKGQK